MVVFGSLLVLNKQEAHQLVGQEIAAPLKFDPKHLEAAFSTVLTNFDKCRSEVAGDIISSVAVYYVGRDVRATFGEPRLNSGRIILLFFLLARPVLRITFVQYLIAFCSQPEATSDVISGVFVGSVIPDNRVKFGDHRVNLSGEIPTEAVLGGIFHCFFSL